HFVESGPHAESTWRLVVRHRSCQTEARPRCVGICKRERRDARPLIQDRAVAPGVQLRPDVDRARTVHLPWRSNDVRTSCEDRAKGRGEHVSCRRATVWNVAERAEGKKVEGRDAAFGGRPPRIVESCSECAECSEPPVHLWSGASVSRPSTFFPSAPRPAPARRALDHPYFSP